MKNWQCILTICALVLVTATGCDAIIDKVKEIDPQAIEDAQEFIEEQNIDLQETQIRARVIARALAWVNAPVPVPYSQSGEHDGYRPDCSGFISYAWQLQKDGKPVSPDRSVTQGVSRVLRDFVRSRPGVNRALSDIG